MYAIRSYYAVEEEAKLAIEEQRASLMEVAHEVMQVSDKLDGLLNLVGELVTVQAQLSQTVKDSGDRHLHGVITSYSIHYTKLYDSGPRRST